MMQVHATLDRAGWSSGEGSVHHALGGALSRRLVRECLAELKATRRSANRQASEDRRTHVKVLVKDAIWSVDGTHLGRDERGRTVVAEIARDVASTKTLGASIGPPASSADVVAMLDRIVLVTDARPLVVATDGGPENRGPLDAWCERHDVVHLTNLPQTPEHNPWVEHGNREIKDETVLGKGNRVHDTHAVARELVCALDRIDGHRPRRTRGWKTARQSYGLLPAADALIDRERFVHAVHCARTRAVQDCKTPRQERLAEREAVLATLNCFGLITRHRGRTHRKDATAEDVL
jgi:hypothetical protein